MVQETPLGLFIILFLHQTTTLFVHFGTHHGCLSSCSYIKPQHSVFPKCDGFVVYHLVPTSNHNVYYGVQRPKWLFIILFLHQTTTSKPTASPQQVLFIILFLHQTTTAALVLRASISCLSSCSYIKPQQVRREALANSGCLSSCSYIKPQPVET